MTIGPLRPGRPPADRVITEGLDKQGERRISARGAAEENDLRARKEIATRADAVSRSRDSVTLQSLRANNSQTETGAIYSKEEIQKPESGKSTEIDVSSDRFHAITLRIRQGFYDRPDIKAKIADRILDEMEGSIDYEG